MQVVDDDVAPQSREIHPGDHDILAVRGVLHEGDLVGFGVDQDAKPGLELHLISAAEKGASVTAAEHLVVQVTLHCL